MNLRGIPRWILKEQERALVTIVVRFQKRRDADDDANETLQEPRSRPHHATTGLRGEMKTALTTEESLEGQPN